MDVYTDVCWQAEPFLMIVGLARKELQNVDEQRPLALPDGVSRCKSYELTVSRACPYKAHDPSSYDPDHCK